jgi:hypothetical protein
LLLEFHHASLFPLGIEDCLAGHLGYPLCESFVPRTESLRDLIYIISLFKLKGEDVTQITLGSNALQSRELMNRLGVNDRAHFVSD